jgi:hypothetical protein
MRVIQNLAPNSPAKARAVELKSKYINGLLDAMSNIETKQSKKSDYSREVDRKTKDLSGPESSINEYSGGTYNSGSAETGMTQSDYTAVQMANLFD